MSAVIDEVVLKETSLRDMNEGINGGVQLLES